eukprot:GHVU01219326.1.p1 GENE.GHVU01219326.1~~GHVU01219326.1.p1  ORF type:complete len:122 (+),score=3.98 GHVU01219326.1:2532-2897(+)
MGNIVEQVRQCIHQADPKHDVNPSLQSVTQPLTPAVHVVIRIDADRPMDPRRPHDQIVGSGLTWPTNVPILSRAYEHLKDTITTRMNVNPINRPSVSSFMRAHERFRVRAILVYRSSHHVI